MFQKMNYLHAAAGPTTDLDEKRNEEDADGGG